MRCYSDLNYRVFVYPSDQNQSVKVLVAPWGLHGRPNGTNLLDYYEIDRIISNSFAEHSHCVIPWASEQ